MSQCALYAGALGIPLAYVSGDEALCAETRRLFPMPVPRRPSAEPAGRPVTLSAGRSPRRDSARHRSGAAVCGEKGRMATGAAHRNRGRMGLERPRNNMARWPGVRRVDARTVAWTLADPRHVYSWPSERWHPATD